MMNLIPGNKYLFDTTVFIDILRGKQIGKQLYHQARFLKVYTSYSIITEAELWRGIGGFRTEAKHIEILKPYVRYFVNVTIARNAGRFYEQLRNKYNIPPTAMPDLGDCLIAATAKFYGLRLLSANSKHMSYFTNFGIIVDIY